MCIWVAFVRWSIYGKFALYILQNAIRFRLTLDYYEPTPRPPLQCLDLNTWIRTCLLFSKLTLCHELSSQFCYGMDTLNGGVACTLDLDDTQAVISVMEIKNPSIEDIVISLWEAIKKFPRASFCSPSLLTYLIIFRDRIPKTTQIQNIYNFALWTMCKSRVICKRIRIHLFIVVKKFRKESKFLHIIYFTYSPTSRNWFKLLFGNMSWNDARCHIFDCGWE